MLKIGDFSKLSRISIRMLRHYDEIGLLKPSMIDPSNGYRYYNESQLTLASKIFSLKNMGFSLSIILDILSCYSDSKKLEEYLSIQKSIVEEEYKKSYNKLLLIESTISKLRKDDNTMKYSVTIKDFPKMNVASLRKIIPSYEMEEIIWHELMEELNLQEVKFANPCYSLAIFHDMEHKEKDVDVEIQTSIVGNYTNNNNVIFKQTDELKVISITFKGHYNQIHLVNKVAADWVSNNRYEFNGAMFNIYHVSPATESNPDNWITEACFPIKKI
ncbi:MerR family transcriptional regulator [Clostridium massiliodielmoense]|uniref:MerR family transcriptional regulator n=1 Tax=Clostridium massiliodielmoense TaxID=1776385 RepID=UPI0004D68FC8|nr:MerR family transcriptional regulator [Clostridium massiliodielmoense]KEH97117.1 MerR family transcriptional regulator [Clostridium botulinum C/D str. BKT12695]